MMRTAPEVFDLSRESARCARASQCEGVRISAKRGNFFLLDIGTPLRAGILFMVIPLRNFRRSTPLRI